MADVARAAGCSLNTVSRALNGKPDVSAETRARVLEVVERLGYIPHANARSLAAGRSRTVGLVIADAVVPVYATIIGAVQEACDRRGYTLLLGNTQEDVAREDRAVRVLREHMVAGLILAPVQTGYEHLLPLRALELPVVLVVRDVAALGWDYVGIDNASGAYAATKHLIGLGHRRIGYVGAVPRGSTAQDRQAGFRRALKEHGIAPQAALETLGVRSIADVAGAYAATNRLLESGERMSALFLYSSQLAPGVYRALREAGRRVPEDVAVVGQGEFPLAPYLEVPLTHVHHPVRDVGIRAADLLFRRIQGERRGSPEKVILPGELVVAASCGAGPGVSAPAGGGAELLAPAGAPALEATSAAG
jgi:LacI family transcriptional regulator